MRTLKKIGIAVGGLGLLAAVAIGVVIVRRGPTGATTGYGGTLAAQDVPDFPSQEPARWVNGAPVRLADARGQVLLIEVWHPS
jgi:hypothetical protein